MFDLCCQQEDVHVSGRDKRPSTRVSCMVQAAAPLDTQKHVTVHNKC